MHPINLVRNRPPTFGDLQQIEYLRRKEQIYAGEYGIEVHPKSADYGHPDGPYIYSWKWKCELHGCTHQLSASYARKKPVKCFNCNSVYKLEDWFGMVYAIMTKPGKI